MRHQEQVHDPAATPETSPAFLDAVNPGLADGDGVTAASVLVELGQCQRAIRSLIHTTIGGLVTVSRQTLPSVAFALTGLIRATEMAANKTLDEAEALGSDHDRLGKALGRLEASLDRSNPAIRRAWSEVMESNQAVGARVIAIMSVMAFQDLTTQQLEGAIKSVEEVRGQLVQMLALLDLPADADEPVAARPALDPTPAASRQALADQLWAEMRPR
jgi:chemotaxis regulatin CheY-phosphate phosphatase CheZ